MIRYALHSGRPHYTHQLAALVHASSPGADYRFVDDPIMADMIIVASRSDARTAAQHRKPVLLLEHGAGQSYVLPNGKRIDASGDEHPDPNVIAHLAPNIAAVEAARPYLPNATAHIIGSPWLAHLEATILPHRQPAPGLIVYMPHWNPPLHTAARGSWPWAAPILRTLHMTEPDLTVGYAPHPRHNLNPDKHPSTARLHLERHTHTAALTHASAILTDNTSMGWEAAALGIPTIWLQAPEYDNAADDGHGLRHPGPWHVPLTVHRTADDVLTTINDPTFWLAPSGTEHDHQPIRQAIYPTQNDLQALLHESLTNPNKTRTEVTA